MLLSAAGNVGTREQMRRRAMRDHHDTMAHGASVSAVGGIGSEREPTRCVPIVFRFIALRQHMCSVACSIHSSPHPAILWLDQPHCHVHCNYIPGGV